MSKKPAPNPLLIRLRYANPLPPPPFPPKLLHIKTDPARYANYGFLSALESEREIPVVVDSEAGMPIDLGREKDGGYGIGAYWEGDRSVIMGNPSEMPELDPDDLALLVDAPATVGNANASGLLPSAGTNGSATPSGAAHRKEVSWLRRTEYFGDASTRPQTATPQKVAKPLHINRTHTERLSVIKSTFASVTSDLSTLRHPTKPHLRAKSSFPVLPDQDLYPNVYVMCRFNENPSDIRAEAGAVAAVGTDPRLEAAVFRPVIVRGEARMVYYLPRDEQGVREYKRRKLQSRTVDEVGEEEEEMEVDESMYVEHVRDYEIKDDTVVGNRLLLVVDEGQDGRRPPGAYYTAVNKQRTLRRRRARAREDTKVYDTHESGEKFFDGYSLKLGNSNQSDQFLAWKEGRIAMIQEMEALTGAGEEEMDGTKPTD